MEAVEADVEAVEADVEAVEADVEATEAVDAGIDEVEVVALTVLPTEEEEEGFAGVDVDFLAEEVNFEGVEDLVADPGALEEAEDVFEGVLVEGVVAVEVDDDEEEVDWALRTPPAAEGDPIARRIGFLAAPPTSG